MKQGRWRWVAALGCGLLLRLVFFWKHPRFVGDTLVYGDLAHNLLAHGVYGLTEDGHVRATMIRLPGYPMFLALCFLLFGTGNYLAVVSLQVLLDLVGCWLLGRLAVRMFGERVGLACVWVAALCPWTANYAVAALTETLSILCVVVGIWGFVGWMAALRGGGRGLGWATAVGLAVSGAVLLRPDGVLSAGVLLPAMAWVCLREDAKVVRRTRRAAWVGVGIATGLLAGCLGAWAGRNWRVFHVLQPLAPKYANDPGEPAPLGFARWYRTWGTGLGDTARVYWEYDGGELRLEDLPAWAFDTPAQRSETARVYVEYNADTSATPGVEAAFARLAAERVQAHPIRFYGLLPLARLGDMWLRPRTELLPHMAVTWWREGPRYGRGRVLFAWAYGVLNAALLVCAGVGLWRWRRAGWGGWGVAAAAMIGFVILRCALLLTIDNSEPRYVLECYPVVILLAATTFVGAERSHRASR